MEAEDNKGIERQRMNYDQELHLYEKLRINYSHLIMEPRDDTETILNSVFSRTSLVRLLDKITIDTEHPFPGNGGITRGEAMKLENGVKFLSLYGMGEDKGRKNSALVDIMRKTDPELIDEIIRVTKLVLNEIRDKYRFEIVTMQQKAENALNQEMLSSVDGKNLEEIFSQILAKNANILQNDEFMKVFRKMKIYSTYSSISEAAKAGSKDHVVSQEDIEKLIYALQFLKFLFLVRVENYGTKDILRFDKFLKRASDLHPEWLNEIEKDYNRALRAVYGKNARK